MLQSPYTVWIQEQPCEVHCSQAHSACHVCYHQCCSQTLQADCKDITAVSRHNPASSVHFNFPAALLSTCQAPHTHIHLPSTVKHSGTVQFSTHQRQHHVPAKRAITTNCVPHQLSLSRSSTTSRSRTYYHLSKRLCWDTHDI